MSETPFILSEPIWTKGPLFGDVNQPRTQGIYEQSETQQYELGTQLRFNDGRIFRYAKNGGTALVKNLMNSAEDQDAKLVAETQSTSGAGVAVGDREIIVDITTGISLAEDELAGGTVFVESSTAIGDDYPIIASKVDGSDDTLLRLLLRYPIRTAWGTGTVITLMKSPWMEVDVFPTTAVNMAVGVNKIAVTANYFCWLQTGGPCAIVVDNGDTLVKGEPAGAPGTAGAAGEVGNVENDGTDQVWGTTMYGIAGDAVGLVYLTLDK
jgi:hypothetical protein